MNDEGLSRRDSRRLRNALFLGELGGVMTGFGACAWIWQHQLILGVTLITVGSLLVTLLYLSVGVAADGPDEEWS